MIDDDTMENSIAFLAQTDEEYAELKVDVERQAWVKEQAEHRTFQLADGTIPDRKAGAALSADVSQATEKWLMAMLRFKKLDAKRATAALRIEVWRTIISARKQGMVI
jgi:hypothetical protein